MTSFLGINVSMELIFSSELLIGCSFKLQMTLICIAVAFVVTLQMSGCYFIKKENVPWVGIYEDRTGMIPKCLYFHLLRISRL